MTEITATRLTGIKATETKARTSLFFIFIETTISGEGGQIVASGWNAAICYHCYVGAGVENL
ncbi:hypothetical protein [Pseudomonas sp. CBZ-4]|uniref:hypothetical protein n=1 Tax=Pseudomonas sp. CBZ-4 TaxID=1163065 RepID=UPI0003681586|nr:hypothetical protein [Pseudomonas sp. CBZ-4]